MGMYTELVVNVNLNAESLSEDIKSLLRYMTSGGSTRDYEGPLPDHELFEEHTRWPWMLRCSSYYHPGVSYAFFEKDPYSPIYTLSVRSSFKNYANEVELFLDWLNPFIEGEPGDFIGYSRYEETEQPTLHFKK